ncbi:hypothetical protein ONS95_014793 [Cadophora gregata]|uniref:uncharacterized protein n=1 Tax=Cadophora gregata TaxID=51156 RepID=UPI0026DAF792|nr:uncharacterized protein ONS95_014793 [Cadophora gregata]KAK0113088.1 hypothetical protein ONS95_014793 [Cadophora gregata]
MPDRLDGFYYIDTKGLAWAIDKVDFHSFCWNRLITALKLLRKALDNATDAKPLALVLHRLTTADRCSEDFSKFLLIRFGDSEPTPTMQHFQGLTLPAYLNLIYSVNEKHLGKVEEKHLPKVAKHCEEACLPWIKNAVIDSATRALENGPKERYMNFQEQLVDAKTGSQNRPEPTSGTVSPSPSVSKNYAQQHELATGQAQKNSQLHATSNDGRQADLGRMTKEAQVSDPQLFEPENRSWEASNSQVERDRTSPQHYDPRNTISAPLPLQQLGISQNPSAAASTIEYLEPVDQVDKWGFSDSQVQLGRTRLPINSLINTIPIEYHPLHDSSRTVQGNTLNSAVHGPPTTQDETFQAVRNLTGTEVSAFLAEALRHFQSLDLITDKTICDATN